MPLALSLVNDDRASFKPNVSKLDSVSFRLLPGSMLIEDADRYLHRVSPVLNVQKHWTICSFMALSQKHDVMYCWG